MRDPEVDAPCTEALMADPMPHWALGDPAVREAIELGIDKQKIVDKLLYGATTVGTAEINVGWAKVDVAPSAYDPEKAKTVLEEAGWIDEDGNGVRECHECAYAEEGRELKLKIQTTTGNKLREQVEQVLVEMMSEIGVEFYIENVDSATIFGSYASGSFRRHGQYDMMIYSAPVDIDPQRRMEVFYHSSQIPCDDNNGSGSNYNRYIDERVDELIELAGSSPDLEVRKQAYQEMSQILADSRNSIFLYNRVDVNLFADYVKGWEANTWDYLSWDTQNWWLE